MTTLGRVQQVLMSRFALREAEMTPGCPMESLGIDSLAALELALDLEDEFGIRFPDQRPPFATLADVVEIVERELARKGVPVIADHDYVRQRTDLCDVTSDARSAPHCVAIIKDFS